MNKMSLNIIQTDPVLFVKCKKIPISIPHFSPLVNQNFMRKLYGRLGSPIYGYFENNIIYYFGSQIDVLDLLFELKEKYGISYYQENIQEEVLSLKIESHKKIFQKTFYDIFRNHLESKGFTVPRGRQRVNNAIPSSFLQSQVDYPLIHRNKFHESFSFKLIFPENNRIMLQIDPCISVLIPYTEKKQGDYVIPSCFEKDCEYYTNCPVIPSNSVIYVSEEKGIVNTCMRNHNSVAIVFDPKKQRTLKVPSFTLFSEGKPENIPYKMVRNLALKSPESRKSYINRFIELISDNNKILLSLGDNMFIFNTELINLEYIDLWNNLKDFHNYSFINPVEIDLGEDISYVDPFQGLKKFGTYSHNKSSDMRYTPPNNIRLFTFYPSSLEVPISSFLRVLKGGHFYYPGFNDNINPYNISMHIEKIPIDYENEESYINKCKARIINILQEQPWRIGYIVLFIIPKNSIKTYNNLKDFSFSRNIKAQMIKEENIINFSKNAYVMYNFSLSIYTKAGGTPWVIDPSYFSIADCYIGQAFSRKYINRFGTSKFFFGAADVFNAWGEHISFALHQGSVDQEIKGLNVDKKFMKELMRKSIDRYIDKVGIPNTILIHRAGQFINKEIEAVKEILHEKKIESCYLVHVQHGSHIRGFDASLNEQVRRGIYFRMNSGSCILFPTGYLTSEKKEHKMGTPKSVQLNIKKVKKDGIISKEVSNKELFEICRNYLGFTRLRWNSLSIRLRDPLTLFAARVVAERLKDGYRNLEGIGIRDVL